jgi:hypothetical protein
MLYCNKDTSGRQWECNDGTMNQRQKTTGILAGFAEIDKTDKTRGSFL